MIANRNSWPGYVRYLFPFCWHEKFLSSNLLFLVRAGACDAGVGMIWSEWLNCCQVEDVDIEQSGHSFAVLARLGRDGG
jgi:hypothetical protein